MHRILRRVVLPAFTAGGVFATGAPCQAVNSKLDAVNTVLDFRINWVGDFTKFDACSIFEAVGKPADFPRGVLSPFLRALDSAAPDCGNPRSEESPASGSRVVVDSIAIHAESATTYITVHKGEQVYREDYHLVNRTPGAPWGLREVRTWGATRAYPSQPSPPEQRGGVRKDGTR